MTSLPLEVPKRFRDIPDAVTAYDICLGLEKFLLLAVVNKGDDVGSKLIYVRILGYLVHHFPTDQGLGKIVEEIISSVDDSALQVDVGKIYYDHYITSGNHLPHPTQGEYSPLKDCPRRGVIPGGPPLSPGNFHFGGVGTCQISI